MHDPLSFHKRILTEIINFIIIIFFYCNQLTSIVQGANWKCHFWPNKSIHCKKKLLPGYGTQQAYMCGVWTETRVHAPIDRCFFFLFFFFIFKMTLRVHLIDGVRAPHHIGHWLFHSIKKNIVSERQSP